MAQVMTSWTAFRFSPNWLVDVYQRVPNYNQDPCSDLGYSEPQAHPVSNAVTLFPTIVGLAPRQLPIPLHLVASGNAFTQLLCIACSTRLSKRSTSPASPLALVPGRFVSHLLDLSSHPSPTKTGHPQDPLLTFRTSPGLKELTVDPRSDVQTLKTGRSREPRSEVITSNKEFILAEKFCSIGCGTKCAPLLQKASICLNGV